MVGIPKTGIETEMAASWTLETKNRLLKQIPVGRLGIPEDAARAARFLYCDTANYLAV